VSDTGNRITLERQEAIRRALKGSRSDANIERVAKQFCVGVTTVLKIANLPNRPLWDRDKTHISHAVRRVMARMEVSE
jgi:hypothetical protein